MDRINGSLQEGGLEPFRAKEMNVSRSGDILGLYLWGIAGNSELQEYSGGVGGEEEREVSGPRGKP